MLAPVVAGPAPLSHSTQQAGALGTTPGDRSPRPRSIPGRGTGTRGGVPGTGLQEDKRQRRHRHDREEHGHSQRTEAEQLVDEQNRGGEDRHDDEGRQGPDHRPSRPARHHHLTGRTPHQES